MYARIRAYRESDINAIVTLLLERFGLTPHAKKMVSTYSGGNLRKLSTAVAVIGMPRILLLDEPTSGMDPGARRRLWNEIKYVLSQKCSVVLTSHSMEECEALCNRLAIMVDGQFHCFGTVPHLKKQFGEGNIIEVDLTEEPVAESDILAPLTSLPGMTTSEQVGKRMIFQVESQVQLSILFQVLNKLRNMGHITAFTLRQASLDNVFVNFVRLSEKKEDETYEDESTYM